MIKLKDILLESTAPDIFIPRRIEDRNGRFINNLIRQYINDGNYGNLDFSSFGLRELPPILKGITVNGYFDCSNQDNTILDIDNQSKNILKTLENSPKIVYGNFYCQNIELESFKGAPEFINGEFNCSNNKLTSLEYIPKTVNGDFYFKNNTVKFTEKQVRAVCDVKGVVFV
jgi:hypothetical protein